MSARRSCSQSMPLRVESALAMTCGRLWSGLRPSVTVLPQPGRKGAAFRAAGMEAFAVAGSRTCSSRQMSFMLGVSGITGLLDRGTERAFFQEPGSGRPTGRWPPRWPAAVIRQFSDFLPGRAEDDLVHIHVFGLADGEQHAAGEAGGRDFVVGVEILHGARGHFRGGTVLQFAGHGTR